MVSLSHTTVKKVTLRMRMGFREKEREKLSGEQVTRLP